MRVESQPAYVLHARAWRETSLLLEVFSHDFGRVGLVARGVRGARSRLPRALLEPLQSLRLGWTGRGELQTLTAVEPDGVPVVLRGDSLLSALYVNELVVRMVPRNDPHPRLFERYAALLEQLARTPSPAWPLRCFERDLLAAAGYALQLAEAADTGDPVEAAGSYVYIPEYGPVRADDGPEGVRLRGSALLGLESGRCPDAEDLRALRRLMRMLIGVHVGERGLQAWRLLEGPGQPAA